MQSTLGQSQPPVSSMELQSTAPGPAASKAASTSARSRLSPFTSIAFMPRSASSRVNFRLVAMSGRNTTVLRPAQVFAISPAICPRYGSSAVPSSPALKSPFCTPTPVRSSESGIVCAEMRQRKPSLIALVSLYSYASVSKNAPRLRRSPRSGVAVTPSTFAPEKCSSTRW